MSNLTLGLAMLGGLVLAAVVAYNTWASRRNAPRQAVPAPQAPEAAEGGALVLSEPTLTARVDRLHEHERVQPVGMTQCGP